MALAAAGSVLFTANGACEGVITIAPCGSGGFGYDPIFHLPGMDRTMAELSTSEKNRISHRSRTLEKVREFIRQYALEA